MSATDTWTELGLLAERAAAAVDQREAELVDDRIAAALSTVGRADAEVARFAVAAADVARPLHRRVAAVAALHHALRTIHHHDTDRGDNT